MKNLVLAASAGHAGSGIFLKAEPTLSTQAATNFSDIDIAARKLKTDERKMRKYQRRILKAGKPNKQGVEIEAMVQAANMQTQPIVSTTSRTNKTLLENLAAVRQNVYVDRKTTNG